MATALKEQKFVEGIRDVRTASVGCGKKAFTAPSRRFPWNGPCC
ncbi:hypothetical protein [Megasphaera sp.]